MKRRALLATTAVTLGGCSSLTGSGSETSEEDPSGGTNGSGSSDSINEQPGPFDKFEDLSKWTVMAGSLYADKDRAYTGSQSARIRAEAVDKRAMIKRKFESPRNLSNEWPALAMAADKDVDVTVQMTDTDENRYKLRTAVKGGLPFMKHDLGAYETIGEPDLSEIVHIKMSVWAGSGRSVTLWCDDLHFVSRPDTGKVMIQFDKGLETTTSAKSILDRHGFPATVFVNTKRVGTEGRLNVDQLELLANSGWTVASQGAAGGALTQWNEEKQREDLEEAQEWLVENGFGNGANYLAYPLGRFDETTLKLVEENYDLAFEGGYSAHGNVTNPNCVPRAVHPSAKEAKRLLDHTANIRGITTITYRELNRAGLSDLQTTMAYLSELASDGEIKVVLPDEIAMNNLH